MQPILPVLFVAVENLALLSPKSMVLIDRQRERFDHSSFLIAMARSPVEGNGTADCRHRKSDMLRHGAPGFTPCLRMYALSTLSIVALRGLPPGAFQTVSVSCLVLSRSAPPGRVLNASCSQRMLSRATALRELPFRGHDCHLQEYRATTLSMNGSGCLLHRLSE